jgi:hypothetical protein
MRPPRKSTGERVITVMALMLVISIGFLVPKAAAKGLPPILVFAVAVAKWSDGTAAPMHQELTMTRVSLASRQTKVTRR